MSQKKLFEDKNETNNKKEVKKLDISSLEQWLWDAACVIRGEVDAPKYKDYILPLIFLKRISDVYEDEIEELAKEFGSKEVAEEIAKEDHNVVSFYIPKEALWKNIRIKRKGIGEYLTKVVRTIAKENPKLNGVIDIVDYNATTAGQRIISDERLIALIDVLSRHRIGLKDAEPDVIGQAYEYMLRKFAEGSGQSAGEYFTPPEVARLMARLIEPESGDHIYDPTCGSAGLLIKAYIRFKEKYPEDYSTEVIHFYGQEIQHITYAIARMNSFIHKMDIDIKLGDTMSRPAFTENSGLKKFNKVFANPMWNQKFPKKTYEDDPYNRFTFGYPPNSSADWGWIQHMYSSLNEQGKLAVVIDTGCVSRGSGTAGRNKERDIRKKFVENDLIESIILLPENMFYNTSAPGVIITINKTKKKKGEVLLINASKLFKKGRPKNYLTEEGIEKIYTIYTKWKEEEHISKIVKVEEIAKNDYNLSPSRYITDGYGEEILPLEEAIILLEEIEEEIKEANDNLNEILALLGLK
ncbi:MAG: N-6 DNA methylase [Candidatus Heimdallarchaeaceae archaeon]